MLYKNKIIKISIRDFPNKTNEQYHKKSGAKTVIVKASKLLPEVFHTLANFASFPGAKKTVGKVFLIIQSLGVFSILLVTV